VKSLKVESSLEVRNAVQTVQAKEVVKEEVTAEQVTHHLPQTIAPNQVDVSIGFGGVTQGRRVWLSVSQEVTLKINEITDAGFPFGPGSGYLPSLSGITALYVSTGSVETDVSALIAGV
jgi:hypothetical protein